MSEHQRAAAMAQDQIGWTDYNDAGEMATAVIELARVVVALAGEVDRLRAELDAQASPERLLGGTAVPDERWRRGEGPRPGTKPNYW